MQQQLKDWVSHPLTKRYIDILKEHRAAHIERIINMGIIDQDKLGEIAQLKGQINALDLMLNLDILEEVFKDEVIDDS